MTDSKAVKYTFDNDFEIRPEDLEKSRSADTLQQVEAARAQGYSEGVEEGRRLALADIEAHTAQSMEHISNTLNVLQQDGQQLHELSEGKSAVLSLLIAKKIAGHLIAENPAGLIETVILEALRAANKENTLTIHVPNVMAATITERVDALKTTSVFTGDIVILPSAGLHGVDCRVEWTNGGLEHCQDDVVQKIDTIIENFMKAKADTAAKYKIDTTTEIENTAETSPDTGTSAVQV